MPEEGSSEPMSSREAADTLGVSIATVQLWAKLGKLTTLNPPATGLRRRPKRLLFDRAYILSLAPDKPAPR